MYKVIESLAETKTIAMNEYIYFLETKIKLLLVTKLLTMGLTHNQILEIINSELLAKNEGGKQ